MIDINLLRKNFDETAKRIRDRNRPYPQLDEFTEVDNEWRKTLLAIQGLNEKRNTISSQIPILIKEQKLEEVDLLKKEVIKIKEQLENLNQQEIELQKKLKYIMFSIPNIPDQNVPLGKDENDNVELRKWGKIKEFDFQPLPHWELGEKLKLVDFDRAIKLSGSRHTVFINDGARLMRALRNFTLDMHNKLGFKEVQPPIILNPEPLYGTGNLPKYEEDLFKLTNGQYLSPTEEIPLTALYMNEIIDKDLLPIKLTSSTLSFRSEVGSAGRDQKGVIRQHQFYNTEMVIFCKSNESYELLEEMTNEAEQVLRELDLPFRTIFLCTGDMGASAVRTYDIEVWFPCYNSYKEISSCSNTKDYQARGLGIKCRDKTTKETEYVHTLNGTGTSLNRLWVAIVENYQQKDGSILIPKALRKYMNNQKVIK